MQRASQILLSVMALALVVSIVVAGLAPTQTHTIGWVGSTQIFAPDEGFWDPAWFPGPEVVQWTNLGKYRPPAAGFAGMTWPTDRGNVSVEATPATWTTEGQDRRPASWLMRVAAMPPESTDARAWFMARLAELDPALNATSWTITQEEARHGQQHLVATTPSMDLRRFLALRGEGVPDPVKPTTALFTVLSAGHNLRFGDIVITLNLQFFTRATDEAILLMDILGRVELRFDGRPLGSEAIREKAARIVARDAMGIPSDAVTHSEPNGWPFG